MTEGYYILKRLKEGEENYVPTLEMCSYGYEHPIVDVVLTLPTLPTEAQFDGLRTALKDWAKMCGYGELAQGIK